jgi:hypothetical protein
MVTLLAIVFGLVEARTKPRRYQAWTSVQPDPVNVFIYVRVDPGLTTIASGGFRLSGFCRPRFEPTHSPELCCGPRFGLQIEECFLMLVSSAEYN